MVRAGGFVHPLAPVAGAGAGAGARMRRPVLSSLLAAGAALAVCAVLLVGLRPSAPLPGALLDKEAAEIAKLQHEKFELEHALKTGRAPLMHPKVLKAEVRRAAQLKATEAQGKQWAATSLPPAKAPVQTLSQTQAAAPAKPAQPNVQRLQAERQALERQIQTFKAQAAKQKDPLMGGILAAYKEDTGAGVLSRTGTMHAARQGLLGRVGDDASTNSANVLGSLAATMTKVQQERMLQAEHVRQLDNVAKAMGDVSPKEALAQRIIALGAQFLAEPDTVPRAAAATARTGPTPASDAARRAHAHGRVARMHARLSAARAAGAAPAVAHGASGSAHSSSHGKTHSQAVSAARKRVELLRRELKEAEGVAQLQAKLQKQESELAATHAKEAQLKLARTQHLAAQLPGDNEGAHEKYVNANEEIQKFVGKKIAADEDDDAEDEVEPTMEARFQKKAHGEGYVKGAIYVGSDEDGPDRYGQDGAGPQIIKGKLGDNIVDVGLMGAAGTLEGDVLVPTKLSGVRHRDLPQGNDPKKMSLGHVDEETSNDIVKGTLVDDFGGEDGLQVDDSSVPIDKVSAAMFKDPARTQALAQTK